MNERNYTESNDVGPLPKDARGVITASGDAVEEKVADGDKRLSAPLEGGKELYGLLKENTVEKMKVTDKVVHEHPYQAIGIGFGIGAFIGFLASRRHSRTGM